jgi:hypothetical protein
VEVTAPEQVDGPVRKRPVQWAIEHGMSIADPDGWRRPDSPPFDQPITEDDFLDRMSTSTTVQLPGYWDAIDAAGRELMSLPCLDTTELRPADVRAAAHAAARLLIPVVTAPLFYRLDAGTQRQPESCLPRGQRAQRGAGARASRTGSAWRQQPKSGESS